ncbi:MAG TPA: hypothetical protein VJX73_13370 [Terracidiphilus sp.]|nr:hypothetical protein [Terracidiphilus sp.]
MPSKHRLPAVALLFFVFVCQVCAAQAGQPATSARPALPAQPASTSKSSKPAPATPAEAQPGTSGTPANPTCNGGPCDYEQPHITIATPAPAPAPWSLQDRIKWLTIVLLVLIAYVGVLFGVSTLRKIERQTRYAETAALAAADSAKAALLFAENQAKADRPWILISTKPTPGVINGFSVVATNRGRSPARVLSLTEGMIIVQDEKELPPAPVFKTEPSPPVAPIILLPSESATVKTFQRDEVKSICESPEQVLRVEDWKEKIYLYGKVAYTELVASADDTHETGWCCWYIHGRQKSGMIMAGPLDYNRHT